MELHQENFDIEVCPECIALHDCESACECKINAYLTTNSNVAEQRGETPEQLWGDSQ